MPSTERLTKQLIKLKNHISAAKNYLELQNAIYTFNRIKQELSNKLNDVDMSDSEGRKKTAHDSMQITQQKGLINTVDELIREKIKYFKKVALRKLDGGTKKDSLKRSQRLDNLNNSDKKGSSLTTNLHNSQSALTINSSKPNRNQQISFLDSKDLTNFNNLQQKSYLREPFQNPAKNPKNYQSEGSKRLKQSKSVDKLIGGKNKEGFTFRNQNNSNILNDDKSEMNHSHGNWLKRQNEPYDFDDDSKTQIKIFGKKNGPFCEDVFDRQDQDIDYFRQKAAFFEKMIQTMPSNLASTQSPQQIFEQFHFKIRQKSLQLEEIKGRIKYYQTTNQSLKNRLFNQQKRHEDYITSLKQQIKQQQNKIYSYQKQKKIMNDLIRQYEFKVSFQQKQKLKYIEQIQSILQQKQRSKVTQKSRTEDLRKELEVMAKQQSCMRELEQMLKQQKIESSILLQKNNLLRKECNQLQEQHSVLNNEKQMLEELLELKLEEIQGYKVELYQLRRQLTERQEDYQKVKEELSEYRKQNQDDEKRKEKLIKRKVEKLKEVKNLLAEDL